jgi:signal transduction histidine kinase
MQAFGVSMESIGEFFLLLIQQFAGGPGPAENNLARFGLAAVMWLALLIIAWSRQRHQDLPRERLLVWGFGLALARELVMFGLAAGKVTGLLGSQDSIYFHPLEHGLSMAAVIVVAGAFLRYVLEDERISRRYLQIGLAITGLALLVAYLTWPYYSYANPDVHFNETWETWIFLLPSTILIATAILILLRNRNWLRSVVSLALGFLLVSEVLVLVNYLTNNSYKNILCPIGNALQLLAIPIFGFVYLKEMSIEKQKAEDELDEYRDHLEELVDERTTMLSAQNAIADSLSQSLDLETVLNMALDRVLPILSMEMGLIFLLDRERNQLSLESYRGRLSAEDLELCILEGCPYKGISRQTIEEQRVIIQNMTDGSQPRSTHIEREGIHFLIGAPLISKNHIVGTLTLGTRQTDPLTQTDLELLAGVCNQIGMAVENANLFQESERWAGELSMLHQADVKLASSLDPEQINQQIATQSARLTGCQIACLIKLDSQDERVEIVSSYGIDPETKVLLVKNPDSYELLEELCAARRTIAIEDVQADRAIPDAWKLALQVQSLLCIPIWEGDQPLEFLILMDQQASRTWHIKDIELVESFIARAAVALENANLHKKLEWAAALEERQRIAAEIHDGLAQTISLIGLKVNQATESLPDEKNGEIKQALDDISETISRASVDVRHSIASLQKAHQPGQSLQELLKAIVKQRSAELDAAIELTLSFPEPLYIPYDQNNQVIPIIQEAIQNAWKHSQASRIHINGQQNDHRVRITVEDNGRGFDPHAPEDQTDGHFGIRIMRARAERFGGELQIASAAGQGTRVTLSWLLDGKPGRGAVARSSKTSQPELIAGGGEAHA